MIIIEPCMVSDSDSKRELISDSMDRISQALNDVKLDIALAIGSGGQYIEYVENQHKIWMTLSVHEYLAVTKYVLITRINCFYICLLIDFQLKKNAHMNPSGKFLNTLRNRKNVQKATEILLSNLSF